MSDTIRPGETRVPRPPENRPPDARLVFIGRLRTPFLRREDCPRQGRLDGPDCWVELDPDWLPALAGIERFEHLDLLYWLHRSRRDLLTQSPRSDGETRGTFALRSPVRPNPIGLSRVRLMAREGDRLRVRGLDCLDGTPLLDIKPERCAYTPLATAKPADA